MAKNPCNHNLDIIHLHMPSSMLLVRCKTCLREVEVRAIDLPCMQPFSSRLSGNEFKEQFSKEAIITAGLALEDYDAETKDRISTL